MEFTLFYEGPLVANGDAKAKHAIRETIHTQLDRLWRQVPLSGLANLIGREPSNLHDATVSFGRDVTLIETVADRRFAPLVSDKIGLTCEIAITMLRPGPPGHIVSQGGDIDNRLKTLLDALSMPDPNQVRALALGTTAEPILCLLKTDLLISSLSVKTDLLLREVGATDVVMLIHVRIKVVQPTLENQTFG